MGIINKIKYHRMIRLYFKKIKNFLVDGYYKVDDKLIKKTQFSLMNFYKLFKIKTGRNKLFNYEEGSLFFTVYKCGFLTNDRAFYFINKKERYELYKNNYLKYIDNLPYKTITLTFDDDKNLVVAPYIRGMIYKDLSHFDIFLNALFDAAKKSAYELITTKILNQEFILPWYVQHGDCKNANIIWDENDKFTLIDLEAIDFYPALYDVFYYLFISKKEQSIGILKSASFSKEMYDFFKAKLKMVPDNFLDLALASYAYYTASRLRADSELYEFEFYLFWRKYDSFDDFPLTKNVLQDYEKRLTEYEIK